MRRRHRALLLDPPGPAIGTTTIVSRDRTLIVRDSYAYGVLLPSRPLRWPQKSAGEVLDYSVDLSHRLIDSGDRISSVQASMAPSDALPPSAASLSFTVAYGVPNYRQTRQPINEARPIAVIAQRGVVTTWIAGGVPGRPSTAKISVRTFGGRRFQFLVELQTGFDGGAHFPCPPHSPDFCEPLIWETPRAKFNRPSNSLYIALT